jgi:HAD superfamily hydrolase (TIGR01458 family)
MSLSSLHKKLLDLGLPIRREEIFSAPVAAAQYLKKRGRPPCYFLLAEDTLRDFAEFQEERVKPEIIVVGDIGERWNYELLNELFQHLFRGAELLALHRGKYWQVETGLKMDIGAFIAGLEYVTGKQATVVGKPSKTFYDLVLADLSVKPEQAIMVGDDLDNDVGGAQNAGIRGILVKTGKYRDQEVSNSSVKPDLIIDSIADLPGLL